MLRLNIHLSRMQQATLEIYVHNLMVLAWGRRVQGTERSERGWMTGWDFNANPAMSQGVRRASVGRVSIGTTGEHRKSNPLNCWLGNVASGASADG